MRYLYIVLLGVLLLPSRGKAQGADSLQLANIRGKIVDKNAGIAVAGAQVELLNFSPRKTAQADENGQFVIAGVPVGRQRLRVFAPNYIERIEGNILVTTGKDVDLEISLDENVALANDPERVENPAPIEDVLQPEKLISNNIKIHNPFVLQGGRQFDIEEVSRYAGSFYDPARLAANFGGVYNTNDNQNYIIARGGTPMGVGYRIEGIPIENPNHFATLGNTGAPFPILNTNSLANSDFFLSNFSAEYGNATSAIFDLNIRKGNTERLEMTGQLSFLGAEMLVEGPIKKGKSSFLVGARYGVIRLMQLLRLPIGTNSSPQYQDITFKLNFPSLKRGDISIFGIGGIANVSLLNSNIDSNDVYAERGRDLYIRTQLGVLGINHRISTGNRSYLSTTISQSVQNYYSWRDSVAANNSILMEDIYFVKEFRAITSLSSYFNTKTLLKGSKRNTLLTFRTGARLHAYLVNVADYATAPTLRYDYLADKQLLFHTEAYAQTLWKFSEKFSLYAGLYANHFSINDHSYSVEPRLNLHWSPSGRHLFSLGYSWHSRLVPFIISYNVIQLPDGSYDTGNKNLGLFKSQHLALDYRWQVSPSWQWQTNLYAQYMYDMPISADTRDAFSHINYGEFPVFPLRTNLVSEGVGYNAGVEIALIRKFDKGFYMNLGGSYSVSRYKGSDGIWRSTAYDIRYLGQAVLGKEWAIGKMRRNFFTVDLRFNYHHGKPITPIDTLASIAAGREIVDEEHSYELRMRDYYRLDFKTGIRFNSRRRRISHNILIDIINLTGRNNTAQIRYNPVLQRVVEQSQFGMVPNLMYQLQF